MIGLTFQWEMNFNPDPNKQAQEEIFSRKTNKINHPPVLFNQNLVKLRSSQNGIRNQIRLKIGVLCKLQNILPRESLICKSFIRPHIDYGDKIYNRSHNSSFHQNIQSIEYNAIIAR